MLLCRWFLLLLPLVILNFDVFAQDDLASEVLNQYIREMERTSEKSTNQKYWYLGINGGETILTANSQYSFTYNGRFISLDWASRERGPFLKLFIGKRYYAHFFEVGSENLQQTGGYMFNDPSEDFGSAFFSTEHYSYISGNYLYRFLDKRKFYLSAGLDLGLGIAETTLDNRTRLSGGNVIDTNTSEYY